MVRRGLTARFIEPMECLPVEKIPEGELWTYELKVDGYRLVTVKTEGKVTLYSRRGIDLSTRFAYVTAALASVPDETVIDGELVALDGGYVPGHLGVDSIVIGVYRDKQLHYAARVRAGFVPLTRRQVFERIKPLETAKCPFVNLPEKEAGRWGQGLTAEKMKECVWVKPRIVAEIEFLEWTGADHLRHTKFVGLRDDKDPRKVVRET